MAVIDLYKEFLLELNNPENKECLPVGVMSRFIDAHQIASHTLSTFPGLAYGGKKLVCVSFNGEPEQQFLLKDAGWELKNS